MAAVERGCHVLIAKPIVQTLTDHLALQAAAEKHNVLVAMEVHKRWDPIYADARDRIRGLGDFSFFQSYMSQPKSQLETFRSWAGKSSDISYYLNAHHIDFHAWSIRHMARPLSVHASAASGVATAQTINTEDTITLTVDWENFQSGNRGTAVYTSSWIAPRSDVHSQQRFFTWDTREKSPWIKRIADTRSRPINLATLRQTHSS
jgi:D-galacturonate reductase